MRALIKAAAILITGSLAACSSPSQTPQEAKAANCTHKITNMPDGPNDRVILQKDTDGLEVKLSVADGHVLPKILPSEGKPSMTWRAYIFNKGEIWMKQSGGDSPHITEVNIKDLRPEASREGRAVQKCLRDNGLVPKS